MVLYRTLKRVIETSDPKDLADMEDKLDVFYAAGKLTKEQYNELTKLLHDRMPAAPSNSLA